ncbi:MAG: flagellin [Rhodospirillales bacterium]|nr:flagellin [Rhodospirillales bacterium]
MSLNSVNTNSGAMIALQSLNATNSQLATVQKHISTGYRVADATDDGAAYAIAQGVRSNVGALTSANQQLGNVKGLLSTTNTALTNVSNTMIQMKNLLVKLADGNVQGDARDQNIAAYNSLADSLKNAITDATYNGKTLIGDIGGGSGFGSVNVVRNEVGSTYGIGTFSGSALYGAVTNGAAITNAAGAAALITAGGSFVTQFNKVSTQLNAYGAASNYVDAQVTYNNDKIDALNSGLGALVDADLAKESAQLQALQIRQQLGTQSLSLANQAPQTLLSLFK